MNKISHRVIARSTGSKAASGQVASELADKPAEKPYKRFRLAFLRQNLLMVWLPGLKVFTRNEAREDPSSAIAPIVAGRPSSGRRVIIFIILFGSDLCFRGL